MDLEQLKKRLYEEGEEGEAAPIEDRPKAPQAFEPGHQTPPAAPRGPAPQWAKSDASKFAVANYVRKFFWIAGTAAALVLVGLLVWFFVFGRNSFDKSEVAFSIYGPERIVSGEEVNYIVRYKNNTGISLQNAKLEFIYSEQSLPFDEQSSQHYGNLPVSVKDLGTVSSGQEGQAEFKTRVLGDKDSKQKFSAKLSYQPSTLSSSFVNEADFGSVIISVPLVLNFELAEKIVSGQTINFSLKYLNTSDTTFSDAKIQLEYPEGFVFDRALPSPDEGDGTWLLSEIGSREEGRIVIQGSLGGNEGENKVFGAKIGFQRQETFVAYAQTLAASQVSVSPLFIEQSVALMETLTTELNQPMNYKIKYRNTTQVPIGPVVITLKIDSQAVSWSSVTASNGFFNSTDNTIVWNAYSLPALASLDPGEGGEIGFYLRTKEKLPMNNFADKNFSIVTIAEIDSPNVPLALVGTQLKGVNQLIVKINSRLVLDVKGFYTDTLMQNSGPLPPRVGETTTYTVYFQALNVSNELADTVVEAYLPAYVHWTGRIYPADENIKYDQAIGKITWQIGKLSPGTGILLPVKQVVFQVALIPSISQLNSIVEVVKGAQATGYDTFSEQTISSSQKVLKSDMLDDPTVGWNKSQVTN